MSASVSHECVDAMVMSRATDFMYRYDFSSFIVVEFD